jgi:hypothetical protein
MIRVLRDGEVRLFVALFEQMTRLSEPLIMDILFEPSGEGLAIACKAIELTRDEFAEMFELIRRPRVGNERELRHDLQTNLDLFDKMTPDSAKEVARNWRRNVGYLEAIRDLRIH